MRIAIRNKDNKISSIAELDVAKIDLDGSFRLESMKNLRAIADNHVDECIDVLNRCRHILIISTTKSCSCISGVYSVIIGYELESALGNALSSLLTNGYLDTINAGFINVMTTQYGEDFEEEFIY